MREKTYSSVTDLGELTSAEKEQLSESVKDACDGKPIRKTETKTITEAEFNKASDGSFDESSTRTDFGRQLPGCKSVKVLHTSLVQTNIT